MGNHKEDEPIRINAISTEFMDIESMDIESMKKSIIRSLNKNDSIVRTLYEVLFLERNGNEVEIRVGESDFIKECRMKRKLKNDR